MEHNVGLEICETVLEVQHIISFLPAKRSIDLKIGGKNAFKHCKTKN